jgi:anti-sigma regulatory factor (Ser/Thr protein kinase)
LRQVLLNYLNNALKFTERGDVTLRVRGQAQPDRGYLLRIEVQDTGIGLDAQQQARLFQPFTQADGNVARRWGGTGLGLAICRRLATLMDGEVGVTSTPGRGSTFWFTASLHVPARQAPPPVLQVPTGACALVVDDHVVPRRDAVVGAVGDDRRQGGIQPGEQFRLCESRPGMMPSQSCATISQRTCMRAHSAWAMSTSQPCRLPCASFKLQGG